MNGTRLGQYGQIVLLCFVLRTVKLSHTHRVVAHDHWSGLRGSNPPPRPWQGRALPNELNPRKFLLISFPNAPENWQGKKDSNPRHAVLETAALPAELFPCIVRTVLAVAFG